MDGWITSDVASAAGDQPLAALPEARGQWRDLASMVADLTFETDAEGRFTFIAPGTALGWTSAQLLGTQACLLLVDAADAASDPFRPAAGVQARRARLRRADGGVACLSVYAAPVHDAGGRLTGARGAAQEVTPGKAPEVAGARRRDTLVNDILRQVSREILAPRMMQCALETLVHRLGAEGAAVLGAPAATRQAAVLERTGKEAPAVIDAALRWLGQEDEHTACLVDARPVIVCPATTRFGVRITLIVWRAPGDCAWDAEDSRLAASVAGIVTLVLAHEAIERDMARQARSDLLTGLLNRRAFLEEVERRFDRLAGESLPGTLMLVDLDNFRPFNEGWGHDAGDDVLCAVAAMLRTTFRPTDLVARLGSDDFAVWMDGADEFTAAERAEHLRLGGPRTLALHAAPEAPPLAMSIAIARRDAQRGEDVESLMRRAGQALHEVKRNGRGHWRVSHEEPLA